MMPRHWFLKHALVLLPALTGCDIAAATMNPASAQSEKKADKPTTRRSDAAGSDEILTYPRDKDRVMATVDERNITLGDIVKHIDTRHFKGFENYVSTKVGQFEVRSPLMAGWVRQFADITALRAEARKRDIPELTIRNASRALLGAAIRKYEEAYEHRQRRKFPTERNAVKALHAGYLKKHGMGLEVEGLLDAMVPDYLDQDQADAHLKLHVEEVNGVLTVAQIYVRNRDRKTGALFGAKRMELVKKKIAEIKRRLEADVRFEEVAREMSEDPLTASQGGRLDNLLRIDPRMPASFCRAAWQLPNRKWSGPVETKYGLHFVKRVKWINTRTVLRLVAKNKDVRRMIRAHRKEELLFEVRKNHHLVLKY
jgi:PPIC-type PPIASE domain